MNVIEYYKNIESKLVLKRTFLLPTILGFALTVMLLFASTVQAAPGLPMKVYGRATVLGSPVPQGTQVSARFLSGDEWTTFKTTTTTDSNGSYTFKVPGDDNETITKEGFTSAETIILYVTNSLAQTLTFTAGAVVRANLEVAVLTLSLIHI